MLNDKKKYKLKLDDLSKDANLKLGKDFDNDMLDILDIITQLKFIKNALKRNKNLAHGDLHSGNIIIKINSQKRPLVQIIDPKGYVPRNIHHKSVKIPEAKASDADLLEEMLDQYESLFSLLDALQPKRSARIRTEYIQKRGVSNLSKK